MADQKISADPNLASPAAGDLIPIVDIDVADALKNKTITWSQITALGGGITWNYRTTSLNPLVAANGYVFNGSSLTGTLPSTCAIGDEIICNNRHTSVLTIADNGTTVEYKGTSYTANITLTQGQTIHLICVVANTTWMIV